jgi:hypothetical protein
VANKKWKDILTSHYIGAIATGYVIGRGFEALFAAVMPVVNVMLAEILGNGRFTEDRWSNAELSFISNIFLTGLYFVTAYLMGRWLYKSPEDVGPQ